jgi:hypothetical protein
MYQLPTGPQTIGQVLDSAFKLFGASFRPLLPLVIAMTVITYGPLTALFLSMPQDDPTAAAGLVTSSRYWLTVGVIGLASIAIYLAMFVIAESVAQGRPASLGDALAQGLKKTVPAILSSILFAVAVAVGTVLLVIPGLILMVSLLFFLAAIAIDHKGILESLTYSHGLVWGSWWRTAAILTVGGIIVTVLLYVVMFVFISVLSATLTLDFIDLMIAQMAIQAVVALALTPFMLALVIEIYRDLKIRREGADLEGRIEQLQQA